MNKFVVLFLLISLIKLSLLSNSCVKINVVPFQPTQISINKDSNLKKCIYFPFENPSEGNIILKLAKSNSYTSYIYVYENEDDINYNEEQQFINYMFKIHIGENFMKERKFENMKKQNYYFVIFENTFIFDDELIIYNDKYTQNNYYELDNISSDKSFTLNFKYEYNENNPIIFHFKPAKNVNHLNFQFLNTKENGKISLYLYEQSLEEDNIAYYIADKKEYSSYVSSLKSDIDYYIKIISNGEIDLIFDFLLSKIQKINPDTIVQKDAITMNSFYFFIEKELIYENDEYFNEFTIKLDSINFRDIPFEIFTTTTDATNENDLIDTIDKEGSKTNAIIKRDIDIPYIYHIYYSFNGKLNLVIKINSNSGLYQKQRIIIEGSGGNDLVDQKHDKIFTDNKGYLYPVYLNVSISNINNPTNNNKNRLLFIYTNTTSAIKIFYNENTFKTSTMDIDPSEYTSIDNFVYAFDFNTEKDQKLFGKRQYFTIMIYCPWESSPISFQLTFINDNIDNFKYIIADNRPINSPIAINLNKANEKFYFIGQYNYYATNILFNEVVYGKITAKYKFFNNNEKISRLIYNETANGYFFSNWTPIRSRIDIMEITCISPALVYMHFIDDQAININNIILDKGSQNYIFLNNTNTYNLLLSNELKMSKNVNIEVFIVSQRENQAIDIYINEQSYSLGTKENNILIRYNTGDDYLKNFTIQGKGTPTALRVRVSVGTDAKNVIYYKEYEKSDTSNKISKRINVHIHNKNVRNTKLCYTFNFQEANYLYQPKEENCFSLNYNEQTTISMYNPWNKYLNNNNKLYKDTDSYYLMVYTQDDSVTERLEFLSNEEFIEINSDVKENEFITLNNQQNALIKSSQKENQTVIVHISPINNTDIDDENDTFILKSHFNESLQEGKIYNKKNRTFVVFDDQLIDSFLEIQSENNKYEIKYNIIPNTINISSENINDNYNIEYKSPYIQFKPLIKEHEVDYTIYLSLDKTIDLTGVSNLKKTNKEEKTIYIFNKAINTQDDLIKIDLNSVISNEIKEKKWSLNILAEEKEKYNLVVSYDVIEWEGGKGENNENTESESASYAGKVILWILIIIVLAGLGYAGYYFLYKKKYKSDSKLLKEIDNVHLSMEDQSQAVKNEEGNIYD
jgi:hypothetical protein